MALRYFWRCEGTTLDPTHDFTTGANTVVANNAVLDEAAAIVGDSGILVTNLNQHFRVNSAGISSDLVSQGAFGFRFRVTASPTGIARVFMLRGANFNDFYSVALQGNFTSGGGQVRAELRSSGEGGVQLEMVTWDANLSLNTVYGIVFRWNQATSTRRIEVYTAGGALITALEDSSTAWVLPLDLLESGGIRIGESQGGFIGMHIDNVFIADAFDEPIQNNFDIASATEYDDGEPGGPSITSVSGGGSFRVGQKNVTITGSAFLAAQGTGAVLLCPSNDVEDVNGEEMIVTAWGDSEITFDVPEDTSLPRNQPLYLFVVTDAGASNANGFQVILLPPIAVIAFPILFS